MSTSLERTLDQFDENGFVLLERVLSDAEIGAIVAALEPYERARPLGRTNFEGERSTRVYSLAGKGNTFLTLATHPRIVELLDRLLLPSWLLSTMQSIRLHPGETCQPWHAD